VVKYLVEKAGADVRWETKGKTALMLADTRGHADIADYLRQAISRREYEVSVALASASICLQLPDATLMHITTGGAPSGRSEGGGGCCCVA
jgi:hypothetical protein